MRDFEKKTVNEWLETINGRRDWCYKPERSARHKKSNKVLCDNLTIEDSFDRNRAQFLKDLNTMIN